MSIRILRTKILKIIFVQNPQEIKREKAHQKMIFISPKNEKNSIPKCYRVISEQNKPTNFQRIGGENYDTIQ